MIKTMTTNLMVENVEKSVLFYEQALQLKLVDSVAYDNGILKFAILSDGIHALMLEEKSEMIREFPSLITDKVRGSVSLFVKVDDLYTEITRIKSINLNVSDIRKTFYGTEEITIVDPDGYAVVLAGEVHES